MRASNPAVAVAAAVGAVVVTEMVTAMATEMETTGSEMVIRMLRVTQSITTMPRMQAATQIKATGMKMANMIITASIADASPRPDISVP